MRSQTLDNAIILARIECAQKKIDIDVFESQGGYKRQATQLRVSKKHVYRLSYEKGKTIIRDSKGKLFHDKGSVAPEKKPAVKKESPKEEQKES